MSIMAQWQVSAVCKEEQGAWLVETEGSMPDADGCPGQEGLSFHSDSAIEGLCAGQRRAVVCPLAGPSAVLTSQRGEIGGHCDDTAER